MRPFYAVLTVLLLAAAAAAQTHADDAAAGHKDVDGGAAAGKEHDAPDGGVAIKTYKRLIPADVLRDFPGMCFASTRCATVELNKTWDLTPFCGRSTCVRGEDGHAPLLELVEDCGPLPLANDKCKLDTANTNKSAPFPACCPRFICEDGVQLEYPEIGAGAPAPNKPAADAPPAAAASAEKP